MRGFVSLNLRRIGVHRTRLVLSVTTLAVATALVVSAMGLVTSTRGSVDRTVAALGGSGDIEVIARTDGGFDSSILEQIESTPGVSVAAPIVRTTVLVNQRRVLLLGLSPAATELLVAAEEVEVVGTADGDVAVGQPLARRLRASPGDNIDLVGAAGTRSVRLAAKLGGSLVDGVNGGDVVISTISLAQEISGRPARLDSILVTAKDANNVSALRHRLSAVVAERAEVTEPGAGRRAAGIALEGVNQALFAMAALAVVVAGFVVFHTMSVSALERRREFAIQRALGAPRRSLLWRFLLEAALMGVAGAVSGGALGWWLAHVLVDSLPATVRSMLDTRLQFAMPVWVLASAIASAVLVAVIASVVPSLTASRVPPAEALRLDDALLLSEDDSVRARRSTALGSGVAFAIGVVIALTAGANFAALAGLLIVLGAVGMTFVATRRVVSAAGSVATLFRSPGRLAAESISRSPRRVWANVATVMLALGSTLAIGETSSNLRASATDTFRPLEETDLMVLTAPSDDLPLDVVIPVEAQEAIAALPGVRRLVPGRFAFVFADGRRLLVEAVGPGSNTPLLSLAGPSAAATLAATNSVVLSSQLADDKGLRTGDGFELATSKGQQKVDVAGVAPSFLWPGGVVGMDFRRFEAWFGPSRPSWMEVTVAPGASVGEVRAAIKAVPSDVPLYVYDGRELFAAGVKTVAQVQSLLSGFQLIVVAAASLAILNTFVISLLRRRRELGTLRAVGMSRRVLTQMVVAEMFAIVVIGSLLGTALGLLQHRLMVRLSEASGFPTAYSLDAWPFVLAMSAGVLMGLVGAVVPARHVNRAQIVASMGYE